MSLKIILERPYLRNRLTNFYGTKTKLYHEAYSIIVYGKESQWNNLKVSFDMPNIRQAHMGFVY